MQLKCRLALFSMAIGCFTALPAAAQQPLNPADSKRITQVFDHGGPIDPLHCVIQPRSPAFDFAYRFELAYWVTCSLTRFGGHATDVLIFARVTPEGGTPQFLGQAIHLPETPPNKLKQNIVITGGVAVGEGDYRVELLVGDRISGRISRRSWEEHVKRSGKQEAAEVAIPPHAILPLAVRPWPIQMDAKGLRVTVLLDAAPLNPRTPSLRMWDRAFLLQSLSSLLRQIPCASVRVRAFNLDQQRELFRQDQFDDTGFIKLVDALQNLELGTVSYQVLQHRKGWADMLLSYAKEELTAAEPSDVTIFLGPRTHYFEGTPRSSVPLRETRSPRFYDLEYFPFMGGAHSPDALAILTKQLDGSVYEIASPGDLARSVQKILARVHTAEQ